MAKAKTKAAPKKAAAKPKAEPKGIEITADEVHGLGIQCQRRGDRPDLPKEVADRLVKEGSAKRV